MLNWMLPFSMFKMVSMLIFGLLRLFVSFSDEICFIVLALGLEVEAPQLS